MDISKYILIEKLIFKKFGKVGYIILFTASFTLFISIIDFFLYCFLTNYSSIRLFTHNYISFSKWVEIMWNSYSFPLLKICFFGIVLLFTGTYRSKTLKSIFSK